jgi:DNA methyltransferase 1-associated protein 1
MDIENKDPDAPDVYGFAKYNVDISVPEYDDEKYEAHLRSDDWSKEETDYLMTLVKEYAQKWPIVIDRYEWPPGGLGSEESTALARPQDARSLEALKARYYHVWVSQEWDHQRYRTRSGSPQFTMAADIISGEVPGS